MCWIFYAIARTQGSRNTASDTHEEWDFGILRRIKTTQHYACTLGSIREKKINVNFMEHNYWLIEEIIWG